jgi:ferritin-like metal-binding protein YciE
MKKDNDTILLRDLLVMKLQALYDTEQELVKTLPKLAKAASDEELKDAFMEHLTQTEGHVTRLERIFERMGEKAKKLKSEAIRGIAEDGAWVIKNVKGGASNAALIAAAQYAEHYEIAGYGSAKNWADALGEEEVSSMLEETLEEEKAADEKLSDLALSRINEEAKMGMEEGE